MRPRPLSGVLPAGRSSWGVVEWPQLAFWPLILRAEAGLVGAFLGWFLAVGGWPQAVLGAGTSESMWDRFAFAIDTSGEIPPFARMGAGEK